MLSDIVSDHKERMINLKKYYPFFKLSQISFEQLLEGKCAILDMGYILMAVLRFFIEENNFPDDIDYGEVYDHYLFEFKSTPHLLLFDNRCFDYNFFEDHQVLQGCKFLGFQFF